MNDNNDNYISSLMTIDILLLKSSVLVVSVDSSGSDSSDNCDNSDDDGPRIA